MAWMKTISTHVSKQNSYFPNVSDTCVWNMFTYEKSALGLIIKVNICFLKSYCYFHCSLYKNFCYSFLDNFRLRTQKAVDIENNAFS